MEKQKVFNESMMSVLAYISFYYAGQCKYEVPAKHVQEFLDQNKFVSMKLTDGKFVIQLLDEEKD